MSHSHYAIKHSKNGKQKTMPTDDDDTVWMSFSKDIKRLEKDLPDQDRQKARPSAQKRPLVKTQAPIEALPIIPKAPPKIRGTDLDRRTAERLKKGQMPIESRIDLHGMTLDQAQKALARFIQTAIAQQQRCVLVITGKGRSGGNPIGPMTGAIRSQFRDWLAAPNLAPHILRIEEAQPKDGGQGAFYIFLRRQRKPS